MCVWQGRPAGKPARRGGVTQKEREAKLELADHQLR